MAAEHLQIDVGEIALEGALELPPGAGPFPGVVVCHPHPMYGGDMWNDVVSSVVRAALDRDIAALRFNFRGTGRSGGEHAGGYGERDDVWAALDALRVRPEIDPARLGLAGYSFGAAVSLNAGIAAGVKALMAVSPPPRLVDFTALQGYEIPVLLISGEADQFAPARDLRGLATAIGPQTTCTIVPRADHFWGGAQRELTAAAGEFFAQHLAPR
jgi:alpha/beta superfamily hydrolase